ncbi:uncharacterized protein LOC107426597 isoform X2 [Ziziphus jujuba]|uniref:Uncharacterized protein LOC107426597 isoform X2 n=1 Tax=Ziziphus jujuba TaxID=326968 RepID=A0A6P4AD74_ZIZJJ|nr:uncharacterized protein LOC107426597 isoform X2 [Ziziphus jujuba]
MDLSSWFRRSLLSTEKKTKNPDLQKHFPNQDQPSEQQKEEEELLGLTDKFIDFLKTFTLETFKKFPLPAAEEGTHGDDLPTTSGSVRKDLTEWQERHAKAVLLRVKEISQLRYKLCPGYLKEHQFWRIYFSLVKSHVTELFLVSRRINN